MTLAPPDGMTDTDTGPPQAVATVTVVLVLRGPASALPQTLDSLARQARRPDRMVVVDLGEDGNAVETVRAHADLATAIPTITYVTVPATSSVAAAVHAALVATEAPGTPVGGRRRRRRRARHGSRTAGPSTCGCSPPTAPRHR